jgi:hypothetical protein
MENSSEDRKIYTALLWVISICVMGYTIYSIFKWPIVMYNQNLKEYFDVQFTCERKYMLILMILLYITFIIICICYDQWLLLILVTFTTIIAFLIFFIIIPFTMCLALHSDVDTLYNTTIYEKEFYGGIFKIKIIRKHFSQALLFKYKQHLLDRSRLFLNPTELAKFREIQTLPGALAFIEFIRKKRRAGFK